MQGTGKRFLWEERASLCEDSPPRCFALGRGMSLRAELSLGLFHAGVGAGHAVPFGQLCPAVHWQAKSFAV